MSTVSGVAFDTPEDRGGGVMIDLAQEIADVDRKLADAARAEQSAAELRERRAELLRAQQLEQEAAQRNP